MHWWARQQLRSKNPQTRREAVEKLMTEPPADAATLVLSVLDDPEPAVRKAGMIAIAKLQITGVASTVVRGLRDTSPEVREESVCTLRAAGDANAVSALVGVLNDSDPDVREAAVEALAKIQSKLAIEPLVPVLADPQSSIRNAVAGALPQIDPEWSRSDAARRAIPALKTRLTSSDYRVRQAAADVLGRIGEIQHAEPTLNSFTDPVHDKQMAVVQSLLQMAADWDDDVRLAAVEALGRVGDERAREFLAGRLNDAVPWVRQAAECALKQLRSTEAGTTCTTIGPEDRRGGTD